MNNFNLGNPLSLGKKVKLFFQREYFANWFINWLLILGLLANLVIWFLIWVYIKPSESNIILHYNVYFGVDLTGESKQIYFLPLIGIILYFINFFLSIYFYAGKERIAAHILLMAGLMLQLSVLISVISVILINY